MKITAGIGCIEDYTEYCRAGASEVFGGYVPLEWNIKYGKMDPLNRREVQMVNVQLGSMSELDILSDMKKDGGEVSLTFNSLYYSEEQRLEIVRIVEKCLRLHYKDYIVADYELIKLLLDSFPNQIKIHVSGEFGELNRASIHYLRNLGVSRIIFPRQTTIEEMKELINEAPNLEYEAFILNEKCHYTGAYCNSLHCDELCHLCQVPFRFINPDGNPFKEEKLKAEPEGFDEDGIGATGCGICSLYQLKEAGITHLKVVGRGNGSEQIIRDIKAVHTALEILNNVESEKEYKDKVKQKLFPDGCSKNCYYV